MRRSAGDYQVRVSIVVSIPACHAGDRGSIPRHGGFFFSTSEKTIGRNPVIEKITIFYDIACIARQIGNLPQ